MLTNKKWLSVFTAPSAARKLGIAGRLPLLLAVGLLVGCSPPARRYLLEGERLIGEGRPTEAVEPLQQAIALLGTNATASAQAWNYLGLAFHYANRPAEAAQAYQNALSRDFNLVVVRFNRGCLFLEHNSLSNALNELTTYTTHFPKDALGWSALGTAQLRARQLDLAERSFQRVLELYPGPAEAAAALNNLGHCLALRRRPSDAFRHFNAALRQSTNFPAALLNQAIVAQQQLNDRSLALDRYRAFLEVARPSPLADAASNMASLIDADFRARAAATNPPVSLVLVTNPPPQPTNALLTTRTTASPPVAAISPPAPAPQLASPPPVTNVARVAAAPPSAPPSQSAPAPPTTPSAPATAIASPVVRATTPPPPTPATNQIETRPAQPAQAATPPPTPAPQPKPEPLPEPEPVPEPAPQSNPQVAAAPNPAPEPGGEAPVEPTPESAPAPALPIEVVTLQPEPEVRTANEIAMPPKPAPATPQPAGATAGAGAESSRQPSSGDADAGAIDESKPKKKSLVQRLNPLGWFGGKDKDKDKEKEAKKAESEPAPSSPASRVPVEPSRSTRPAAEPEPKVAAAAIPAAAPVIAPPPSEPAPVVPTFPRYTYVRPAKPAAGDRAGAQGALMEGVEAHRRGQPAQALGAYRRAAVADPSFFEAQYNLGVAAFDANAWPEALAAFERALALKPDDADARLNFALALDRANYPIDAANELDQLLARAPDNVDGHATLANVCARKLADIPKARQHYARVLELDPRHPQAIAIRRWLASHQGRP